MISTTRVLYALGFTLVCFIFYLTGPHASATRDSSTASNADARLARWIEAVVPPGNSFRPSRAYAPPAQGVLKKARPAVPIDPFPLGAASSTVPRLSPRPTSNDFVHVNFGFQEELVDLVIPRAALARHKSQPPHNFANGRPRPTFATFLSTRNASLSDPYFAATLSLVYRLLWAPTTASKEYPVTVFVAPFVAQEQVDILKGAGAIVRKVEFLDWAPNVDGVYARLRDQFAKLHMWSFTEFSRIAFMDADALPIKNIDEVFDIAERRECLASKLTTEDLAFKNEICDYVFAGVENVGGKGKVHGGFLVFEPNKRMYQRLLRNYIKVDEYDNSNVEQGFLNWQFSLDGPFPASLLPRKFNGFFPLDSEEGELSVVHEKLWTDASNYAPWLEGAWEGSWRKMTAFYNGALFSRLRQADSKASEMETSTIEGDEALQERSESLPGSAAKPVTKNSKGTSEQERTPQARPPRPQDALSEKQQRLLNRQKGQYRFEDLT